MSARRLPRSSDRSRDLEAGQPALAELCEVRERDALEGRALEMCTAVEEVPVLKDEYAILCGMSAAIQPVWSHLARFAHHDAPAYRGQLPAK